MASRTKHHGRSNRDSDSLEAVKPLLVLVLFGTILYGAYSVVQKGPATDVGITAPAAGDAPAFTPPAVDMAAAPVAAPAPAAGMPASATAVAATPALSVAPATPAAPAPAPALPPVDQPPAAAAAIGPPAVASQAPAMPAAMPPAAIPPATSGSVPAAAAIGAGIAGAAAATAAAQPPVYLTAESAPPPTHDPIATPAAPPAAPLSTDEAATRPDRYATLAPPQPAATPALQPDTLPAPPPAAGSPAAFATAWADAHEKLAAGRYAEALSALSVWYDDPSLGLEESQRLEDLLGQLAGTVIYSQQDLLLPPHVVAPNETLQAIALPLGVSPRLLAKINGIDDPPQLMPGEHLKVLRGPFDAVVSVSRRRLSLQLGGSYAGSFPVVVGRQFLTRVGSSVAVVDIAGGPAGDVLAAGATSSAPSATKPALVLDGGLTIEAADDPGVVSDTSPTTSLVVSVRDLAELVDILGPGSKVLIRQ